MIKKIYYDNIGHIKASGILRLFEFNNYFFILTEIKISNNTYLSHMKQFYKPLNSNKSLFINKLKRITQKDLRYDIKFGVTISKDFYLNRI